ncbi:hypothetical protein [Streptomyces hyaluromycini]|uniref:hypothetical protein n=1 Tax=Streptomyces hyaluromycini TaxID=1377993 RepID=UPI000B5CCA7D|nr:hypothetical protein [Streptomyces hyaluromycini]
MNKNIRRSVFTPAAGPEAATGQAGRTATAEIRAAEAIYGARAARAAKARERERAKERTRESTASPAAPGDGVDHLFGPLPSFVPEAVSPECVGGPQDAGTYSV